MAFHQGTASIREAQWVSWPGTGLEGRDLGLSRLSDGYIVGQHIRAVGGAAGEGDWHCYDLAFEYVFVLEGSLELETLDGQSHLIACGDFFAHSAFHWHRDLRRSSDLQVIRLTSPEAEQRFDGVDSPLPEGATGRSAAVYSTREGTSPQPRADSVSDLTEGRIDVRVIDAAAAGGEVAALLSRSQWLYVIDGEIRARTTEQLEKSGSGDSLSIVGPPHEYECSEDFMALSVSTGPSPRLKTED